MGKMSKKLKVNNCYECKHSIMHPQDDIVMCKHPNFGTAKQIGTIIEVKANNLIAGGFCPLPDWEE